MKRLFCGLAALGLLFGASKQVRSDFIYWTDFDGGDIRRANLDGSGQTILISNLPTPTGISLDLPGAKMYWSDNASGNIRRANLDGSEPTTLVMRVPSPGKTALDVAGGQIYWVYGLFGTGGVQRANLDGSEQTTIISGINGPRSIALDLRSGKMYLSEGIGGGPGEIRRYNLDGSGQESLITGLSRSSNMALDLDGGKLYWADAGSGTIRRANLVDGSDQEILVSRQSELPGIALDLAHGKVYWSDHDAGKIERANLDGTAQETVVTGLSGPSSIALQIELSPQSRFMITVPPTAVAGTAFDVTVTALDAYGNIDVNYQGTVTFSTTDSDSGVVLPTDYTFTTGDSADNGVHTFSSAITLTTVGDQTLTVTDTASGIAGSATITVSP